MRMNDAVRDSLARRVDTVGQIVAERPFLTFHTRESI